MTKHLNQLLTPTRYSYIYSVRIAGNSDVNSKFIMDQQRTRKRPRLHGQFDGSRSNNSLTWDRVGQCATQEEPTEETLWSDQSLFAIEVPSLDPLLLPLDEGPDSFEDLACPPFGPSTWLESVSRYSQIPESTMEVDSEAIDWLNSVLYPDLPSLEDRFIDLTLENPYEQNETARHVSLRPQMSEPLEGAVNGYIKFRILNADFGDQNKHGARGLFRGNLPGMPRQPTIMDKMPLLANIPLLPPDFGKGVKLDAVDNKLLKFCTCP